MKSLLSAETYITDYGPIPPVHDWTSVHIPYQTTKGIPSPSNSHVPPGAQILLSEQAHDQTP